MDTTTVCEAFDNSESVEDFNASRRMAEELTGKDQLHVIPSLIRAARRLGCACRWWPREYKDHRGQRRQGVV